MNDHNFLRLEANPSTYGLGKRVEKTIFYLALLLIVIHLFILRISIMQKRDKSNDSPPAEIQEGRSDTEDSLKSDKKSTSQAIS